MTPTPKILPNGRPSAQFLGLSRVCGGRSLDWFLLGSSQSYKKIICHPERGSFCVAKDLNHLTAHTSTTISSLAPETPTTIHLNEDTREIH